MKIDPRNVEAFSRSQAAPAAAPQGASRAAAESKRAAIQPDAGTDQVTISAEARARATEANVPSSKIDALKAQVQAGTYEPDAAKVASRLLDTFG